MRITRGTVLYEYEYRYQGPGRGDVSSRSGIISIQSRFSANQRSHRQLPPPARHDIYRGLPVWRYPPELVRFKMYGTASDCSYPYSYEYGRSNMVDFSNFPLLFLCTFPNYSM